MPEMVDRGWFTQLPLRW